MVWACPSNTAIPPIFNPTRVDYKMSANPPKRARQPNFTHGELVALVDGYEEHRRAIESRGEGPRESQAKQNAWDTITANLFAVSGIVRTPAEVKKKWCDVKSAAKARAAAVRRSMATTGGGPEDVAPLDEFEARVASTLDPEAVFGVSGGLDICAPSPGMNAYALFRQCWVVDV
ncbi:nuclear apoptosis-inducing factor 1-like [Rhipicephalus sanguineus]|uniref:nuclear apoptosis-inducing factor 1-like n=1 Tax=Rhipicephalus sanguineus TaxID=34632 RepID=UPI0020C2CA96|nr:nuclear apoptosis-inducing factor 1-like [Rhipicephalus sanguineus]